MPDSDTWFRRWRLRFLASPVSLRVAAVCGSFRVVGEGSRRLSARELGRRFGLRLHLFGTTPPPPADAVWRDLNDEQLRKLKRQIALDTRQKGGDPADAWRAIEKSMELDHNLQQFRAAGVAVRYHVCDLGDRARLSTVLDRIRRDDGPLEGIVHGAGVRRPAG